MGVRSKFCKTTYVVGKSILAGTPISTTCVKVVTHCLKDIVAEHLPSLACM